MSTTMDQARQPKGAAGGVGGRYAPGASVGGAATLPAPATVVGRPGFATTQQRVAAEEFERTDFESRPRGEQVLAVAQAVRAGNQGWVRRMCAAVPADEFDEMWNYGRVDFLPMARVAQIQGGIDDANPTRDDLEDLGLDSYDPYFHTRHGELAVTVVCPALEARADEEREAFAEAVLTARDEVYERDRGDFAEQVYVDPAERADEPDTTQ